MAWQDNERRHDRQQQIRQAFGVDAEHTACNPADSHHKNQKGGMDQDVMKHGIFFSVSVLVSCKTIVVKGVVGVAV